MSTQPGGPPDDGQPDDGQPDNGQPDNGQPDDGHAAARGQEAALSALEEALRQALASMPRAQVLSRITSALPIEIDAGEGSSLHGKAQHDRARRGTTEHDKVQKVSVSMPASLAGLVRARTGAGGFSRYVTDAVQGQIDHDLLGDLLDELEAEYGQVPEEVREQTRQMWPDQAGE